MKAFAMFAVALGMWWITVNGARLPHGFACKAKPVITERDTGSEWDVTCGSAVLIGGAKSLPTVEKAE